jgi:hypothetical protein
MSIVITGPKMKQLKEVPVGSIVKSEDRYLMVVDARPHLKEYQYLLELKTGKLWKYLPEEDVVVLDEWNLYIAD